MFIWDSFTDLLYRYALVIQVIEGVLAVAGFCTLVRWPIWSIWPDRDRWLAEYSTRSLSLTTIDLKKQALSKDRRVSWTSPEIQSEGDSFKVDFDKERVINGIEFYERKPSNEFPYAWSLIFRDKQGRRIGAPVEGENIRIVAGFPSVKVQSVEIVIKKPMFREDGTAYHWKISNLYFREVKLFGRWISLKI